MRNVRLRTPRINRQLLRLFCIYAEWYMRRSFHTIRLSGGTRGLSEGRPLLVVMNHPSWWDPLIALTLAQRLFPERSHYGPIDSAALGKYSFFEKLGFFGIDPGTSAGAVRFLRLGESILATPRCALWVTAQGSFCDPRVRPVELRSGVGHLLRRLRDVTVLPVAVEYPFWEEKYPEALIRIGTPMRVDDGSSLSGEEWTGRLCEALGATQDLLASDAMSKNAHAFRTLSEGRAGVGGTYDLWRAVRAALRGEKFDRAHSSERS